MDQLDDIVFKNKNKSYGAYVLRKRYYKSACYGLLFTLLIFISITIYAYRISMNANDYADLELNQEMVDFEQYNALKNVDSMQVNTAPPKKEIAKKDIKDLVVVDTIKSESDTLKVVKLPDLKEDSIKNDSLTLSDSTKAGSANGTSDGQIYTRVDVLPEFPGGAKALRLYLQINTHYPSDAIKNHIIGTVKVQFLVTKTGNIDKVSIKQSVNPLLDNESIRIVKSFPKWKPAKRKGLAIDCWWVLPLKFLL
jgi:protein TonB